MILIHIFWRIGNRSNEFLSPGGSDPGPVKFRLHPLLGLGLGIVGAADPAFWKGADLDAVPVLLG